MSKPGVRCRTQLTTLRNAVQNEPKNKSKIKVSRYQGIYQDIKVSAVVVIFSNLYGLQCLHLLCRKTTAAQTHRSVWQDSSRRDGTETEKQ